MGVDGTVGGRLPVTLSVRGGRDGRNRGQVERGGRSEEPGVAEAEDAAVARRHPVAAAVGCGRHADDGLVQADAAGRTEEAGVAVVEDAPVAGYQPVALAVGGGLHADDGLVEVQAARRAVEGGVAIGEDAPVGGHLPVALPVGGGRHADDRRVERLAAHGAVEGCVAVGVDGAVRRRLPVATAAGGGCHSDDGGGPLVAGRAVVGRTADAEDCPVAIHQPFAWHRGGTRRMRAAGGECRRREGGQAVCDGEERQAEYRQFALTGLRRGRERACGFHECFPLFRSSRPPSREILSTRTTRVAGGSYGHFLLKSWWGSPGRLTSSAALGRFRPAFRGRRSKGSPGDDEE